MKKLFITAAAICCSVSLFAQLPAATGKRINKNTKVIDGWLVQAQPVDRKTIVVNTNEKGIVTSHVFSPVKGGFIFFSGKALKFQKGDSFEMTCKVKGTGSVTLGYIGYNGKNAYLFSKRSEVFKLTGKVDTFKASFDVVDGKEYPVSTIRPFLGVGEGSKVELLEVTMEEE